MGEVHEKCKRGNSPHEMGVTAVIKGEGKMD
jgi:hypothetical protein